MIKEPAVVLELVWISPCIALVINKIVDLISTMIRFRDPMEELRVVVALLQPLDM